MNPRSVGIFAVVVAFVVGGALWYLNSEHAPHVVPKPDSIVLPAPKPTPPPSSTSRTTDPLPPIDRTKPPLPTPPAPKIADQPAVQMTDDDRKIDEVLRLATSGTDQDNTNTAQRLINLLTQLTPEGQVECVSHISNLLSDEEYARIMPVWKNPTFNPDVLDSIYTDMMNRDDKVKLPALLEAVRLPTHPQHEEAKSTLEVFLDNDYENDFGKWERAVKAYLKKQADEEAGLN
jgi:hypothetical protein